MASSAALGKITAPLWRLEILGQKRVDSSANKLIFQYILTLFLEKVRKFVQTPKNGRISALIFGGRGYATGPISGFQRDSRASRA